MDGQCIDKLDLEAGVRKRALRHAMDRLSLGLRRRA